MTNRDELLRTKQEEIIEKLMTELTKWVHDRKVLNPCEQLIARLNLSIRQSPDVVVVTDTQETITIPKDDDQIIDEDIARLQKIEFTGHYDACLLLALFVANHTFEVSGQELERFELEKFGDIMPKTMEALNQILSSEVFSFHGIPYYYSIVQVAKMDGQQHYALRKAPKKLH